MKYIPQHTSLQKHIDHYWIVDRAEDVFDQSRLVYDYPGVRPELIFMLEGELQYTYRGCSGRTDQHMLASHITDTFLFDTSVLDRFIVVLFKPRSLASLLPFVSISAKDLMDSAFCKASEIFGIGIDQFGDYLKELNAEDIGAELDQWLLHCLDQQGVGFVTELFNELESSGDTSAAQQTSSLQTIKEVTKYSYSTLERYFKKETGLTPKKYQTLSRYKYAIEEIYDTENDDWLHYVHKYGYFDQSHFIKEVKRFTNFTPQQILTTPGLRTYRPV